MNWCAIIGDAAAISLAAHAPECHLSAARDRPVSALRAPTRKFECVIISVGTRDGADPDFAANANLVRSRIGAPRVIWVLPQNRQGAYAIRRIAVTYQDRLVSFVPGDDGIRPRNHAALWAAAKAKCR